MSNLTNYYTKVDSDITTANLTNNINTKANINDVNSALGLKQNNLTISPMKGESILATNTTSQLKTLSPNPDDNDINISTSSSTMTDLNGSI